MYCIVLLPVERTQEEARLFEEAAAHAYASFRDKAAASRGMSIEDMQAVAQVGLHDRHLACLVHHTVAFIHLFVVMFGMHHQYNGRW